jgi:hypothetical protein
MVCIWHTQGIGYSKDDPYGIIFGRFREEWQLLSWLKHLHEKIWWNDDLAQDLIKAWEKVNSKVIGDA